MEETRGPGPQDGEGRPRRTLGDTRFEGEGSGGCVPRRSDSDEPRRGGEQACLVCHLLPIRGFTRKNTRARRIPPARQRGTLAGGLAEVCACARGASWAGRRSCHSGDASDHTKRDTAEMAGNARVGELRARPTRGRGADGSRGSHPPPIVSRVAWATSQEQINGETPGRKPLLAPSLAED